MRAKTDRHTNNINKYFLVIIFSMVPVLQSFFLKPFIEDLYLSEDIRNFKAYSWRYTVSIFIIFSGIVIFLTRKNIKAVYIPLMLLMLIIFGIGFYFSLHSFIDNVLLLVNSKTPKSEIIKSYEIINHTEQKIFWLHSVDSIHIYDNNDLEKINNYRISKGLKSIYHYRNNDTIKMKFQNGWFDVNYLN